MAPVNPSLHIVTTSLAQGTILQPPSSPSPSSVPPIMITFGVLAVFIGITSLSIGFLQLRKKNVRKSSSDATMPVVEGNDPVVDVTVSDDAEVALNEVLEMRSVSR
jgi:hypothetical protein